MMFCCNLFLNDVFFPADIVNPESNIMNYSHEYICLNLANLCGLFGMIK